MTVITTAFRQGAGGMNARSVCAVIVTYHPVVGTAEKIPRLLTQVQGLVVVDNGSNDEELNPLRMMSRTLGYELIENAENLGVAEALNQGVRWGQNNGFPWVVLFDQDSKISDGFIDKMFAAYASHPARERLGSIHPKYVDPESGLVAMVPADKEGAPLFPMTSGALMPVWIFEKIGWFESDYFIDVVDWEYSFRIRAAGYLVAEASNAPLLHSPGNPEGTTILGRSYNLTHHNSIRRYYISRNSIAFYRKYFFAFPRWISKSAYRQFRDLIVCLIAEEGRARNFRSFLLGTWDGITGRMGKREGL